MADALSSRRLIGDCSREDDAFYLPDVDGDSARVLARIADENGVIHGFQGGPVQLVDWPDAWQD